jgi:putative ABC transport system permease protein
MSVNALLSFATYAKLVGRNSEEELNMWQWDGFFTYVLFHPDANLKEFEAKLPDFVMKQAGEDLKRFDAGMELHLQAINDIHLDSDFIGEFKANGNRDTVYSLMVVALLIIVIAWINYINLSTAKSLERAREVGVRKVMGGFRTQLIQQFMVESLLINTGSVAFSIALVFFLNPYFGQLTGQDIGFALFKQPSFWLMTLLFLGVGSVLSGLYPAFVLSSFRPVEVLKGKFRNSAKGLLLRKGMVVLQFVASVALMVGTFTVYQQIQFMRSQKLGINIDQTMVLRSPNITDSTYEQKFLVMKERLLQYPEVSYVTGSSSIPGASPDWNAGGIRRLSQREDEAKQYRVIMMDHDFVPAYGLETVAGRPFSGEVSNEHRSVLLNESAVRIMGFQKPDDAIDDQIYFWGDTFRIVGVVKNYRQESLKKEFEPLIFRYNSTPDGFYSIKFNASAVNESIAKFEEDWKAFFPGNPFEFFFMDEHYNKQYKADQLFGRVFGIFSGLAIFISCLGLFGLSSLTAIQRTKEIGVRKVLGASVPSILRLVSRDYLVLMLIAIVMAVPLSSWVMTNWLQDFANRISLNWWIFFLPSFVIVCVAMATVSIHTWQAARTNPANSLRIE